MNPAMDILIQGSHGKDDPERARLPFIFGNAAATAGREVTVLLTSDAVWLVDRHGGVRRSPPALGWTHEGNST